MTSVSEISSVQVAGYYEALCRQALGQSALNDLVNVYLGTSRCEADLRDDHEIEFSGASFQPLSADNRNLWDTPAQRAAAQPPYILIYRTEIFGHYCDECNNALQTPTHFAPDYVSVPDPSLLPPRAVDVGTKAGKTVGTRIETIKEEMLEGTVQGRILDRSILNPVLCNQCSQLYVETVSLEPLIERWVRATPVLSHCYLIEDELSLSFDHGTPAAS